MADPIQILYFAALADDLDCRNEQLTLSEISVTIDQLKDSLSKRGGNWSNLKSSDIRCAVNQELVKNTSLVSGGDEVAFFPPVTGG